MAMNTHYMYPTGKNPIMIRSRDQKNYLQVCKIESVKSIEFRAGTGMKSYNPYPHTHVDIWLNLL